MSANAPFDQAELRSWVERQAALGPRRPGSAAGHANEDFLEAMLRSFGLEAVRKEPIPITCWAADEPRFEVIDGGTSWVVEAFPIPYVAFTPPEGIEGPLCYVDPRRLFQHGSWRGAIVVTEIRFPCLDLKLLLGLGLGRYDPDGTLPEVAHPATWVRLGWHLYGEAARRGAAGFIGILRDQPGGSARMYAPYGFRERDILDKPLPGLWVGRGSGERLRDLARSGTARARLRLTGTRAAGVTHNVVGEIPGALSGSPDEEVLVLSCHHDAPFTSPVEDGSGIAVVLALAKHFAAARGLWRRLVVLLTAGHFYGSIGTRTFIAEHPEIVRSAAAGISIEHVAREAMEDEAGRLVPSGRPEATGVFIPPNRRVAGALLRAFEAHDVRRVALLPAEGPLGDYPPTDGGDWHAAGVPVVNAIANPVYLLTDDDALSWVDAPRMARMAAAFADVLRRLDTLPRAAIAAVDSRSYHLLMKGLERIVQARTTLFGLHPLY